MLSTFKRKLFNQKPADEAADDGSVGQSAGTVTALQPLAPETAGSGEEPAPAVPPDGKPGPEAFDEAWYLSQNPDVAAAVASGAIGSGYDHWTASGKLEGRIAPPGYDEGDAFDEAFYLRCYPMAAAEIAAGRAADALAHYQQSGRMRGYLPNAFAPRPAEPDKTASRFGGFWVDQANANDLIEGREQIGRLTPEEGALLRHWVAYGYVVLRQMLPPDVVERAAAELKRAYSGEMAGAKFECPHVGGFNPIPWDPAVQTQPTKALDLHWLSADIRNLIFAKPIRAFLELVFERRVLASQSLTFLRGSAQHYHQDTLYVPYSRPTQFAASWVALEDVAEGGGELTYFPGSHRTAEYLYGGEYKTLWDAQRMLRRNSLREETRTYSADLEERNLKAGLVPEKFMAKKGDVLLWHADLAHGGLPISVDKTRASVVTHYCPAEVAPLTFERGGAEMRLHEDACWYSTGHYRDA